MNKGANRTIAQGNPKNFASRFILVGVLIASLIGASAVRHFAYRPLATTASSAGTGSSSAATLSGMDSFAIGLLLGGFRGPLVMAMWMNIEAQKNRRDYEDIDTRINLVRLLQPEFDDVHLFQIGNKAYNLSVQLTSLAAKYSAVLEGLDYARSVDRERPFNINILAEMADIYFHKLGESTEKFYYRARVRDDSLAPVSRVQFTIDAKSRGAFVTAALDAGIDPSRYVIQEAVDPTRINVIVRQEFADVLRPRLENLIPVITIRPPRTTNQRDTTFRRFAHDPLLDVNGNLLAEFSKPRAGAPVIDNVLDGSELQFLRQFEPFPQGVSTFALAFNYYSKCEALRQSRGLRSAKLPPRVLSSRSAIALRFWTEEEFDRGRHFEAAAAGLPQPAEKEFPELELLAHDQPLDSARIALLQADALNSYKRVIDLISRTEKEYAAHIERFTQDRTLYLPHLTWLDALSTLVQADRDFILAQQATDPELRSKLIRQSRDHYLKAREMMYRNGLLWFVTGELAQITFPRGYSPEDVASRVPADLLSEIYARTLSGATELNLPNLSPRELAEFNTYAQRCAARIQTLDALIVP